jgi:hypothetical protein
MILFCRPTFVPLTENDFATQVCITGAKEGFDAANKFIASHGEGPAFFRSDLLCNNMSLRKFSHRYYNNGEASLSFSETSVLDSGRNTRVKIMSENKDKASSFCVDAAYNGYDIALSAYGIEYKDALCNDKHVKIFISSLKNKEIVMR